MFSTVFDALEYHARAQAFTLKDRDIPTYMRLSKCLGRTRNCITFEEYTIWSLHRKESPRIDVPLIAARRRLSKHIIFQIIERTDTIFANELQKEGLMASPEIAINQ